MPASLMTRFRLDGQVALVTGAGRGIGRGIAVGFAEAGATVYLAARTMRQLEETASLCAEAGADSGGGAVIVKTDVRDADSVQALVDQAKADHGRIDVLVNNAGGTPPSPMLRLTDSRFADAFDFNVTSAFRLSRLVVPAMLEQAGDGTHPGGAILNISSAMSHFVDSGFTAYGTAKAALNHLTRLMAAELAPKVRVNALAVGSVRTTPLEMLFRADATLEARMVERTPLARLGEPDDIAACALWLCSDAGSWMTGKVVEIDGGTVDSNWPLTIPGY